jgi:serine/threonine-protein kinase
VDRDGQASAGGAVSDEVPAAPGGFAAGSQIAGYRLEEQIGLGGMAVVFRAHDERLDRSVALKILAPGLALDDAFRQRFIRESRAAAAVDDPHIIPVFEAGEAGGVLFIAMRFVRGGDVRTLLDRDGPLPPARATEIIAQVASALDAAHAHGLVHRDVKPANMLLDASTGGGRPDHIYLSDFGLSKQSLAPSGLTSTGQFLGTLDYVAPEQIEGRPVDGRADQYALACAAFELLSGAPPFKRDEGLAVVYAQLSEPPPPLTARRAGLPAAIDQVMARAMAKSPAGRYRTCRDFAAALREVLGLSPVDSGPAKSPAPARPPTEIALPTSWAAAAATEAQGEQPAAELPQGGRQPEGERQPDELPQGDRQPQGERQPEGERQPDELPQGDRQVPQGDRQQPQGEPAPRREPAAGPPTQAAGIPVARSTTPGLTEPPSGPPGWGAAPGYGQHASSWWRSRRALAAACVAALVIGGGAYVLLGHSSGTGKGNGTGTGTGGVVGPPALALPRCTTATAKATALTKVGIASVALAGNPFGVSVTEDGRYSFVSLGNSVAMLSNGSSGAAPVLKRTIPVVGAQKGEAVTGNGYLLATTGSGAAVISIADAERDTANPVIGTLTSPDGSGAVEVATSPDDQFVFVTLQNTDNMAVFNLAEALAHGFGRSDFIGYVPFNAQPVGIAESSDGRWLYVTSIQGGNSNDPGQGQLSMISMRGAETKPATAVFRRVAAGCNPARVIISANGKDVWVTARQSNSLLGFSAAALTGSAGARSLIAKVAVGANPIGVALVNGGTRIVVADSNLSNLPDAVSNLAVVSVADALAGKPALLGLITSGQVPRQFALEHGGRTLLVTDQNGHELQAIQLADLP